MRRDVRSGMISFSFLILDLICFLLLVRNPVGTSEKKFYADLQFLLS
jgi:hypothetical protein